jgi:hypothetical protein
MKAYSRVEVQLHEFFDLGSRWWWAASFMPRLLYRQRKSSWYRLDRRLGGPQNRYRRDGEEKNSQLLSRLETPIIQPVAQCRRSKRRWQLLQEWTLNVGVWWLEFVVSIRKESESSLGRNGGHIVVCSGLPLWSRANIRIVHGVATNFTE